MDRSPLRPAARLRARRPTRRAGGRGSAAFLVAVAFYGCAGDGPPPQAAGGAFDQIQTQIFNQNCLSAGCHNAQSQAGGLNLTAGASYGQLVDVLAVNAAAQSQGLLRVQPFNADNSFVVIKLTAPGEGEGARMPQGMNPLPQSDIDMIRAWILDGAPPGGTVVPTATPTADPPPATATETPSITPTPIDTATATATVTGSAPPTSTATDTPTITPTPSDSPSPSPTPPLSLFGQIQTTIFNQTCTEMFCHDAIGMSGGLVLLEGQSYGNLVDVPPQNAAALARGLLRVDPGDPDNSFLLVKLTGPTAAEGLRMPQGKPPLPPQQIELVRQWIEQGAEP
jgi:hypothetical protein